MKYYSYLFYNYPKTKTPDFDHFLIVKNRFFFFKLHVYDLKNNSEQKKLASFSYYYNYYRKLKKFFKLKKADKETYVMLLLSCQINE